MQAKKALRRLPRSLWTSTAARNRRACSGLMTVAGSTVENVLGLAILTSLSGFSSSTPISRANSKTSCSTIRLRLAVLGAASRAVLGLANSRQDRSGKPGSRAAVAEPVHAVGVRIEPADGAGEAPEAAHQCGPEVARYRTS